jgi:hypothetical protein
MAERFISRLLPISCRKNRAAGGLVASGPSEQAEARPRRGCALGYRRAPSALARLRLLAGPAGGTGIPLPGEARGADLRRLRRTGGGTGLALPGETRLAGFGHRPGRALGGGLPRPARRRGPRRRVTGGRDPHSLRGRAGLGCEEQGRAEQGSGQKKADRQAHGDFPYGARFRPWRDYCAPAHRATMGES